MSEREEEDRLRAEVRGLRRGMTVLTTLTCLAVVASAVAIVLALRHEDPREALFGPQALYGPRTLVTDRIVTTELLFAYDSDSAATRLFGSPLHGPAPESPGRDRIRLSLRPGRIDLIGGGEQEGMMLSPGFITLLAGTGRVMEISPGTPQTGIRLFAPDGWHSWPVDTLRHPSIARRRR